MNNSFAKLLITFFYIRYILSEKEEGSNGFIATSLQLVLHKHLLFFNKLMNCCLFVNSNINEINTSR